MSWRQFRTVPIVDGDGRDWEIDLLTGETDLPMLGAGEARAKREGMRASAHLAEGGQFSVTTWVPEDSLWQAEKAVLADAERRIQKRCWTSGKEYEV